MRLRNAPVLTPLVVAFLSGCATTHPPLPEPMACPEPMAPAEPMAKDPWVTSLRDAAVIEASEVAPLAPIEGDTLRVVTWTKYPDSFKPGEGVDLAWGETWVTRDGALQAACRAFPEGSLLSDVQMLLGLPVVEGESRFAVTMTVQAADLFRPCADPSIEATTCSDDLPEDLTPDHALWYARQVAMSYQLPQGFPWTRLGYTYNWAPGANEVGLDELVVKKGAHAEVIEVTETGVYCAMP